MKVLSHTSWGADHTVLLHLYRSLIRSKLDYGAIVYGSDRKSYLAMLDTVHHQGLRLALGAFRTSPVESLYVEADEPSLYLRREKLALQYAIRLAANPSNPAYKITFPPHISEDIVNLYENKPNIIKSFGLRIQPLLTSAKINPNTIEENSVPKIPSWCIRKPSVVFSLHSGKKTETNPDSLKLDFHELQLNYADYQHIYTDGSKDKERVGCAVLRENDHQTMRIPDGASIFTAEAKAIDLALDLVDNLTHMINLLFFLTHFQFYKPQQGNTKKEWLSNSQVLEIH